MRTRVYTREEVIAAPLPTSHNFKDLTGRKFGNSLVLAFAGRIKGKSFYFCLCSCGAITMRCHAALCESKLCSACSKTKFKTHGKSYNSEYKIWQLMKDRCSNKDAKHYANYGGRGISVCPEWLDSFESFYADLGPRPSKKHSVDRIDNNGNYSPENCRWATQRVQSNNQRSNRLITFNNQTKTMSEWCGGSTTKMYRRVRSRLSMGYCDDCAISLPWGSVCDHDGGSK